jgi:pyruvate/2-oxoglutarate dehydrogenase complex dihydrolipoamide dehydrogenase (E3) component
LPIVALLRSRTMSETRGFMKALVEADGDRILGFTMLGAEAGKVMAVVHTRWWRLCPTRAYATRLSRTPRMAEGLGALFSNLLAR